MKRITASHLLIPSVLLVVSHIASAHPGGRDAQGCHICKTNCEKHGVKYGERHCHMPDGSIYTPGEGVEPRPRKKSPRGPKEIIRYEFPTDESSGGVTLERPESKSSNGKQSLKGEHKPLEAYVEKVSDGDTIKVRLLPSGERQTVRIQGIDCPESHVNAKCKRGPKEGRHDCAWQVPRGLKASKRAAELMKQKTVYLECSGKCTKGKYGRALRYVRLPDPQAKDQLEDGKLRRGLDFGLIMIKEGLCEDYGWKYPHHRGKEYMEAQIKTRLSGKGIWAGEELPPLVIGKGLAESLKVKAGDVVWMVSPPVKSSMSNPDIWFRIADIFETGKLELDTKRVCVTLKGLKPLVRGRKVATLEAIVASQHDIAGVQVLSIDEGEATADNCKKALGGTP